MFTNLREGVQGRPRSCAIVPRSSRRARSDLRDTIDKAREAVDAKQAKLDRPTKTHAGAHRGKASSRSRSGAAIAVITETHGVLLDIALALDPPGIATRRKGTPKACDASSAISVR